MNFEFVRNSKIALTGVNGIGKSTFLSTIQGLIPPFAGEVSKDPFVSIGYFEQEDHGINKSGIDDVWDTFPHLTQGEVRALLAKCGLNTEQMSTMTKAVSGGEKAKVRIAKLMVNNYNVLVFDEPTNHLDVLAKEALKEALSAYKGSVILVSHEPEFYEGIVDEIINVEDFTLKTI